MADNNSRKRRKGFGGVINLTAPGTMFTLGFIALAIGMGLLLSRGFAPKYRLSDPGEGEEYEMIPLTPDPVQKGLQLKTLKFKSCASTVTFDLLLDRSGSMGERTPSNQTKISRLKEAVNALLQGANDQTVIGIQSFSSPGGLAPFITNDVPVGYYKDVKDLVPKALASYQAEGSTPTHDALTFSYNILKQEIPKFPGRKFNFILVSDGAPCPGVGCPGNPGADQDPRKYSPYVAQQIKDLGVNVFTVGIFSQNQNDPELAALLKDIASSASNYYPAANGDEVQILLKQISSKICSQAPGA